MEPYLWPVILLGLGLMFVVLEIFVPSGGVLSLFAACSIIAAIVVAFLDSMVTGTVMLLAATVFVPIAISIAVRWWPHTPMGRSILIRRPESDDEVLPDTDEYHRDLLVGKIGIARCDLLPSGDVQIEGRTYDAVSNGPAIDRGQRVRVVDVNTQRLVVRELSEAEMQEETPDDVLSTPLDSLGIEPFDEPLA